LAPFINRSNTSPDLYLPGSLNLANEISQNIKVRIPTDCNKEAIVEAMQTGNIIHIASHAFSDASQASGYFLAVGPQIEKFDHCLYLDEIYGVQSKAALIVLDACETARSSFGSSSLSRAFYLSGAQQIISTQWRSSDRASNYLMTQLYEQLANGTSTAHALTKSKRSYLQHYTGVQIHPFFWGSHEVWGWSNHTLELGWYRKYGRIVLIALWFSLIGFLWYFFKRETSRT
jgi:CHAT domain-containing protein